MARSHAGLTYYDRRNAIALLWRIYITLSYHTSSSYRQGSLLLLTLCLFELLMQPVVTSVRNGGIIGEGILRDMEPSINEQSSAYL
jgi:hypothetical protein